MRGADTKTEGPQPRRAIGPRCRHPSPRRKSPHSNSASDSPLHPELRTLLHEYDGRHDPLGGEAKRAQAEFLPFGLHLIDAAAIRRHCDGIVRDLAEEAKEDFPVDPAAYPGMTDADDAEAHIGAWVPFAADNGGGIAFVDHLPGPTYGYVYVFAEASGGWPPVETAPRLTDLFERLAQPSEPA
ncbi:SMI1/KNR4 family protein [Yinghuangia aomiensis]